MTKHKRVRTILSHIPDSQKTYVREVAKLMTPHFGEIKRVYHTADIHVHPSEGHHKFQDFANQFLAHIRNEGIPAPNARILIAGDLFDQYTNVSNEQNALVADFLHKCVEMHPTIIIMGNHDCNHKNHNMLDCITPLVEAINDDRLAYFKQGGNYYDNNVIWHHIALANSFEKPEIPTPQQGQIVVGLFHDMLEYSKGFNGKPLQENHGHNMSIFEGCKYVMMGDIHCHQSFLYDGGIAVYAGSPIQHNLGESITRHGFVQWEVEGVNMVYKFIPLENNHAIVKVVITELDDFQKHTYKIDNLYGKGDYNVETVKVEWRSTVPLAISAIQKDEIIYQVKKIWGVDIPRDHIQTKIYITETEDEQLPLVDSIQLVDIVNSKLNEAVANLEQTSKLAYEDLDRLVCEGIQYTSPTRKEWKMISLEAKNIFCFAEVTRLYDKGVNFVVSNPANQGGKTTLTSLNQLLLYGNKMKLGGESLMYENVLNKYSNKQSGYVKGVIEVANEQYLLKREFIKDKKGGIKQTFQVLKMDENGEDLLDGVKGQFLTGKNATRTTDLIEILIGQYQDYVFASYYTNSNLSKWLDTKGVDRYRLLVEYFGLGLVEAKHTFAKKLYNDFKKASLMGKYGKEELLTRLADMTEKISLTEHEYTYLVAQEQQKKLELDSIVSQVQELQKLLVPIKKFPITLEQMRLKESSIIPKKELIQSLLSGVTPPPFSETHLKNAQDAYNLAEKGLKIVEKNVELEAAMVAHRKAKFELPQKMEEDYETKTKEINNLRTEYVSQRSKLLGVETALESLKGVIICEFCKQVLGDDTKRKQELETERAELVQNITLLEEKGVILNQELKSISIQMEATKKQWELTQEQAYQQLEKRKSEWEQTQQQAKLEVLDTRKKELFAVMEMKNQLATYEKNVAELQQLQMELDNLHQMIQEYTQNQQIVQRNLEIQEQIDGVVNAKQAIDGEYQKLVYAKTGAEASLQMYRQQQAEVQALLQKLEQQLKQDEIYNLYLMNHSEDGFMKQIINEVLPKLNAALADFTVETAGIAVQIQFEDKGVKFVFEQNNEILPLSHGSGYEKTVAALAIHFVCMQYSYLPKCNYLVLDEILGAVAQENIPKMGVAVKKMQQLYNTIDIISHNTPTVMQWADREMVIQKTNNESVLVSQ